jgi:CBS domain-containing protein
MTDIKLVRDLMTVGVPTCAPDTPIVDLAQRLLDQDWEGVIVLDAEGHAAGMVSRQELVRAYAYHPGENLTAEAIMSEAIPQIPPDIPLTAAAQIMLDTSARVVFLMHHSDGIQYPAAMLSYTHLLRHLAAPDRADLKDLGIHAEREAPLAAFIKRREEAKRRPISSDSE